ncbi:MAG: glycosyltransferase family 2 protein [Sedimenticola sp.]
MKISILTPSYNQGQFIDRCIQSILNQDHQDVEHIVIDGGSTDNTVDVLKKYKHLIWVSERDDGQADALNKGLKMASGDIIGWINSDDYYENNIFSDVVSHFENAETHWILGNVTFCYPEQGVEIAKKSPKITFPRLLNDPDIVRQQGVFFKKSTLQTIGAWNKDMHMVMDYDLWIKLAKQYTPKMVDKNYAYFLWHAEQKSSAKNTITQIREIDAIMRNNDAKIIDRIRHAYVKGIYLIKSFIKAALIKVGVIDKSYSNIPISIDK